MRWSTRQAARTVCEIPRFAVVLGCDWRRQHWSCLLWKIAAFSILIKCTKELNQKKGERRQQKCKSLSVGEMPTVKLDYTLFWLITASFMNRLDLQSNLNLLNATPRMASGVVMIYDCNVSRLTLQMQGNAVRRLTGYTRSWNYQSGELGAESRNSATARCNLEWIPALWSVLEARPFAMQEQWNQTRSHSTRRLPAACSWWERACGAQSEVQGSWARGCGSRPGAAPAGHSGIRRKFLTESWFCSCLTRALWDVEAPPVPPLGWSHSLTTEDLVKTTETRLWRRRWSAQPKTIPKGSIFKSGETFFRFLCCQKGLKLQRQFCRQKEAKDK